LSSVLIQVSIQNSAPGVQKHSRYQEESTDSKILEVFTAYSSKLQKQTVTKALGYRTHGHRVRMDIVFRVA
jgi:hypothetical protein